MKATRRKVLGLFAMSPLAAKAAADEAIGRLSGTNTNGLGYISGNKLISPSFGDESIACQPSAVPQWVTALNWVKKNYNSLPAWKEAELRREAQVVYTLDPDLAAKRSWSMAVKIQEQRERNFRRLKERLAESHSSWGFKEEFQRKNGFWL